MTTRWFEPRSPAALPLYCVVGRPISHSRSPRIHQAFGEMTGRVLEYRAVEVGPGELADAVAEFRAAGGLGMNVTVPLKEEAWALAGARSARAELAGAANTLWFGADGAIEADNTDGVGLVRDLEQNHAVILAGAHVLLVGAGGAARGVMPALAAAGPRQITVTNRTAEKAQAVAALAGDLGTTCPWGDAPTAVDVVINATSLSLAGEVPPLPARTVGAATTCYDMMYAAGGTAFVDWARAHGAARALDGLGMLVEQAAEAFLIWHGVRPATAAVIGALRELADG
ncbi:MAG: shikimate dehydrogenase [Gammaproteobacteria bacterium]